MFECCPVCSLEYNDGDRIKADFVGRTKMCYKCYNEQVKIIAVDFDATLTKYYGWKGSEHKGEPLEGARDFLKNLKDLGFRIFVVTSRPLRGIEKWLEKNNMMEFVDKITNMKVAAHCYLDDRSLNFSGDYEKALNDIKNFVPYYKK
jgi:hypothetical protein